MQHYQLLFNKILLCVGLVYMGNIYSADPTINNHHADISNFVIEIAHCNGRISSFMQANLWATNKTLKQYFTLHRNQAFQKVHDTVHQDPFNIGRRSRRFIHPNGAALVLNTIAAFYYVTLFDQTVSKVEIRPSGMACNTLSVKDIFFDRKNCALLYLYMYDHGSFQLNLHDNGACHKIFFTLGDQIFHEQLLNKYCNPHGTFRTLNYNKLIKQMAENDDNTCMLSDNQKNCLYNALPPTKYNKNNPVQSDILSLSESIVYELFWTIKQCAHSAVGALNKSYACDSMLREAQLLSALCDFNIVHHCVQKLLQRNYTCGNFGFALCKDNGNCTIYYKNSSTHYIKTLPGGKATTSAFDRLNTKTTISENPHDITELKATLKHAASQRKFIINNDTCAYIDMTGRHVYSWRTCNSINHTEPDTLVNAAIDANISSNTELAGTALSNNGSIALLLNTVNNVDHHEKKQIIVVLFPNNLHFDQRYTFITGTNNKYITNITFNETNPTLINYTINPQHWFEKLIPKTDTIGPSSPSLVASLTL
jgi:hypothetical protein